MKIMHILLLMAACVLLVGGAPKTAVSKSSPTNFAVDNVSAAANQELAAARRATAKYHSFQQALDDGYIQTTPCIPGEGFHYAKLPFDCGFNPANPEILHYAPKPNGEFQLVAVEYIVPKAACGLLTQPPEGFSGDADEWFSEIRGTVWALNAWIWFGNPDGVFAERNPKITCD